MNTVFYTENTPNLTTNAAAKKIFRDFYRLARPEIVKGETGKPFLKNAEYFFSVAHTKSMFFLAVNDRNVGIDAEEIGREIDYSSVLTKFPIAEREEIKNKTDFLRHWTAKESAIKWLGGSIAYDLKKISFLDGVILYKELPLPVSVFQTDALGHVLTLCADRTGKRENPPEFIRFSL